MSTLIFQAIILITIFNYLLDSVLSYLNKSRWTNVLPNELQDVFDKEKFEKSLKYKKESYNFSFLSGLLSFVLMLLFLLLDGVKYTDNLARNFSSTNPIVIALLFAAIIALVSDLLSLPFQLYSIFVLEQKYGFNTTTIKTFVADKCKSFVLGGVIGGLMLAAFIWFCLTMGNFFWIWVWFAFFSFSLFMAYFYSNLIVPLFNKQTPLESGSLRELIEAFCVKANFPLDNVFIIDGSKRSNRANAYFTGFGKRKRIVIYDTLREQLDENEIVAVLAHEIGHYKRKHIVKGILSSFLQMGATLYLLSFFINLPMFHEAFGVSQPAIHIGLLSFAILYSPISMIIGLVGNYYSRKNEYEADAYASSYGLTEALISGLKKLSANNLSNLTPHPIYVFFHYSHPPLLERIRAMRKNN